MKKRGAGGDERIVEIEEKGVSARYRDSITEGLGLLASAWDSEHKNYMAQLLRSRYGSPYVAQALAEAAEGAKERREAIGKKLVGLMRQHPLGSWLKEHPGVGGVHSARLVACIGDPLRFPGKVCESGHHVPADFEGDCTCPVYRDDGAEKHHECGGKIGPVRRGTGVRSAWHFCGLHAEADGRSPRRRKGVKATWNPIARSCVLQPDGIADQIVRHQVEPWIGLYYETKKRIGKERGFEFLCEIDMNAGSALRPFQIDAIARKVAAKAFVGDLLLEWKRRVDKVAAVEPSNGSPLPSAPGQAT